MSNEHKHEWKPIGNTTFNGDTWMQECRVYVCATCGTYGSSQQPHAYYDYKRRKPDEVQRLRTEEQAAYEQLLADHRADPAGVEERYRAAEEAKHQRIQELIAKSRAERAAADGMTGPVPEVRSDGENA